MSKPLLGMERKNSIRRQGLSLELLPHAFARIHPGWIASSRPLSLLFAPRIAAKVYKENARTRGQQEREDQSERVIHVSSGGDGPRVEMSTGGSMFNPEASASPDQDK